jgi:3-hydroxyacyl-[acyl-carrier-protein] dehydratase
MCATGSRRNTYDGHRNAYIGGSQCHPGVGNQQTDEQEAVLAMRWFWIDRFVEFESGRRAVAVKNISIVEEQMDGYLPGMAIMPSTLIIEGLAQTGGLLVGEHGKFLERVVLAKVSNAKFHFCAEAGDTLLYTAEMQDIRPDGAICGAASHCRGEVQAEMELVFAFLDSRFQDALFDPADLLRWLRLLRLYEVGRHPNGTRLEIPSQLLEAESQLVSSP